MKNLVLIVDDSEINREILKEIVNEDYESIEASNGQEAMDVMQEKIDDLHAILLDLYMPKVDGIKVLEWMDEKGWIGKVPVLIISSETSTEVEKQCFKLGISDFIHKPFDYDLVQRRVNNMVNLFELRNSLEEKVEKQTQAIKKQYKLLVYQAEKVKKINDRIVEILGTVVECRDYQDNRHIQRVKNMTQILATRFMKEYPEYKLDEEKVETIVLASCLHDIGKISIPDHILLKNAKLTDEEKELIKSHPLRGCEIIEQIKGVWGHEVEQIIYDVCRSHHERYDGRGYPDALSGDKIPIAAQIVSIADAYDELLSERIYKNAYSPEEAYNMIVSGESGMFSPKLIECFRLSREELEEYIGRR